MSAPMVKTATPGIYKRGNRYVVTFRDPYGRQRKRSARTPKEARTTRSAATADVARGEYRELSRVTFVEYVETWLDTFAGRTSKGVRPETLRDYRRTLKREAIPFFGRMQLAAITPQHVKEYVARLAGQGLSAATVRLRLAPVRAVLATALDEGLIRWNPSTGIRVAVSRTEESDEEKVKALSEEELRALLAEIPPEWRLFFEFLAHSGCRMGEAIAFQWRHVDLDRSRILIRRRWYRNSFAPPKSKYGRRDIPLSSGMVEELRRLRRTQDDEALAFTSSRGFQIHQSNLLTRVLKPAAVRAGIGEVGHRRWSAEGADVGHTSQLPSHGREHPLLSRPDREAGPGLAWSSLAGVHALGLRAPARLGHARARLPRRSDGAAGGNRSGNGTGRNWRSLRLGRFQWNEQGNPPHQFPPVPVVRLTSHS
jgi:integrase